MAEARVVIIRSQNVWTGSGVLDAAVVDRMLARGLALLRVDGGNAAPFRHDDRVGIKVNTIGGRALSTRPEVALGLAGRLVRAGVAENDLIVWDRTMRELREAGYPTASGRKGVRVFGTDADGVGYGPDLVAHLGVGSLFSRIQTDLTTASVSLAILKDHGLAGVTAGMKNYFGAIHNPNKYHDAHCDPHVAEVFDAPPIKSKHRLTVLDALVVQFHKGPAYHPRWAGKYGGFVFSLDPVAADTVGWTIIERLRAEAGLPTLQEEGRAPGYIGTAGRMGLGVADPAAIETVEETVA
jgi:uncharacterized protein (DUF362 family)